MDVAADHQPGKARRRLLARIDIGDDLAMAQDGGAVAEALHLFEAMGDIENGAAFARPAAASTTNSWSASCGVSTAVGSSMIRSFGSCSRQRTISMRWRSPTERSATVAEGSSGRPYSLETRRSFSTAPRYRNRPARRARCSRRRSAPRTARNAGTPCRCRACGRPPGLAMARACPSSGIRPRSAAVRHR